jgi:hypothetical protein
MQVFKSIALLAFVGVSVVATGWGPDGHMDWF